MKKMLRRNTSFRWLKIELFVDESFRTHAVLRGLTSQCPQRFRVPMSLFVGAEGIAKINPQDSFDFHIGRRVAIHKLFTRLQTRVMRVSKKLDDLWCGLFNMHNALTD